MNFSELESLMYSRGYNTLADIARKLEATPQAVSNWKARDQVPYHVVARLNIEKNEKAGSSIITKKNDLLVDNDTVSLSDIILKLSEQLKIILLIPFLFMFFTFTYVKLIQPSIYVSSATVLVPDSNTSSSIGGLATSFTIWCVSTS